MPPMSRRVYTCSSRLQSLENRDCRQCPPAFGLSNEILFPSVISFSVYLHVMDRGMCIPRFPQEPESHSLVRTRSIVTESLLGFSGLSSAEPTGSNKFGQAGLPAGLGSTGRVRTTCGIPACQFLMHGERLR